MKPYPLQPGDSIALVAPSSPFDPEGFERASLVLESLGYQLVTGVNAFRRDGYLAGSDLARCEDLIRALRDPSIGALLCIRGGFGSSRLLDWLPFSALGGRPKILLGYSDITFLHAAFLSQLNWVTFHGPNLIESPTVSTQGTGSPFEVLEGKRTMCWNIDPHQVLRGGCVKGRIVGGNLTCFAHLLGTAYFPETSGAILFLEDRGEALYRIDRTFVQLKQAGVLQRISGLILGSFLDCGPSDALYDLVLEHTHSFTFPIVCGMPFGHGSVNEILPLGLPFSLDTHAGTLEAAESPFETAPRRETAGGLNARLSDKASIAPAASGAGEKGTDPMEKLFQEALRNRVFSAATLLVADADRVLYRKTWGTSRQGGAPIDSETLFDLASLTKPLAIAPLTMQAVSEGTLGLEDALPRFFPAGLLGAPHRTITIRQLLNHSSGLPAYEPLYSRLIREPPASRKAWLLESVLQRPLVSRPGTASQYSDLGFMVLAGVLEEVFQKPLQDLAQDFFKHALALQQNESLATPNGNCLGDLGGVRSLPPNEEPVKPWIGYIPMRVPPDPTAVPTRIQGSHHSFAATEHCPWRRRLLEGEVHDENAYCLNGVAGHAGLFGSAPGVYGVAAFLWNIYRGRLRQGNWAPDVLQYFWSRQEMVPGATWALGYDTPSAGNSSTGSRFSQNSVGHLGFTGTSLWIDLDRELTVILLTNRVHPSRKNERIKVFRPLLHDLVMETFRE